MLTTLVASQVAIPFESESAQPYEGLREIQHVDGEGSAGSAGWAAFGGSRISDCHASVLIIDTSVGVYLAGRGHLFSALRPWLGSIDLAQDNQCSRRTPSGGSRYQEIKRPSTRSRQKRELAVADKSQ